MMLFFYRDVPNALEGLQRQAYPPPPPNPAKLGMVMAAIKDWGVITLL